VYKSQASYPDEAHSDGLRKHLRSSAHTRSVTVRLSASAIDAVGGPRVALDLELRGSSHWVDATADLVGRFRGSGKVWVRTVGAGPRAAVQVLFHWRVHPRYSLPPRGAPSTLVALPLIRCRSGGSTRRRDLPWRPLDVLPRS
jgi:hypothetical protein